MKYTKFLSVGIVTLAVAVTGCTPESKTTPSPKPEGAKKEEHAPHGKGPNGGVVFDLGKHHAEFTVDHPKKECTILILDDDEKTPTAIAVKDLTVTTKESKTKDGKVVPSMTIKMQPKDEKDGKASKFVGTDPTLINVADFEGTVTGLIDGKPSQGTFKEE